MPFAATWMDLKDIMLNELSQTKTNTIWYHLYVESKKYTKLVNKTKKQQTCRYGEQTSGYQWGGGRTAIKGWGRGRHKLLGARQARGCTAQHGEPSQYCVVTVNGKNEWKIVWKIKNKWTPPPRQTVRYWHKVRYIWSMEENRDPRNKLIHIWSIDLWQRSQEYTMGKGQSFQ